MIYPWHQKPFEVVNKMIQQDHLPHALMITGSEGMGKFEFAMQLIEKLTGYQDLNVKDNAKLDLEQPTLLRRSFYQNLIYCRDSEINEETMKVSNEIRIKQVRAFCHIDALPSIYLLPSESTSHDPSPSTRTSGSAGSPLTQSSCRVKGCQQYC